MRRAQRFLYSIALAAALLLGVSVPAYASDEPANIVPVIYAEAPRAVLSDEVSSADTSQAVSTYIDTPTYIETPTEATSDGADAIFGDTDQKSDATPVETNTPESSADDQGRQSSLLSQPDESVPSEPSSLYIEDASDTSAESSPELDAQYTPDDPRIGTDVGTKEWHLDDVGLTKAWDYVRTNKAVTVAVLDTGAKADHPDLAANIVGALNMTTDGGDGNDVTGHGTHVAGIVSAVSNNGTGVSGTSFNAGILSLRVQSAAGTIDPLWIVSAYDYILAHRVDLNIRVVNMSIAGYATLTDWEADDLCKKIDEARAAGILTVCAAGNSGVSYTDGGVKKYVTLPYPCYPGDYDGVLSVINIDDSDMISGSSNYNVDGVTNTSKNSTKDLCAPGTKILSTTRSGGYGISTGTSMAAPVVSGIAALLFTADPSLTPDKVMEILESTADDLGDPGWDSKYGYGKVNAYAAVKKVVGLMDLSGATVSAIGDQAWTGSSLTPGLTVTYNGVTLDEGEDYTLTYADNTNPGTATVTITGTGVDYTGTATATFLITYDLSLATPTAPVADATYTGSAITPALALPYGAAGVDYTLSYTNNVNAGTATVTATGDSDRGFLGTYSTTFQILPADISDATVSLPDQSYTGRPLEPTATINLDDYTLGPDDYTVTYGDNTEAGTATATFTGVGNFTGTATVTFVISPLSLKGARVTIDAPASELTYRGLSGKIEPLPVVTLADDILVRDRDYVLTWTNTTHAGTATVTATGIGSFADSCIATYTILARDLSECVFAALGIEDAIYTGKPISGSPTLTYTYGDTTDTLVPASDYTLSFSDNVNAGTATVTATGKGNFTGSVSKSFHIAQRSFRDVEVTIATLTYNGEEQEAPVTVTYDGRALDPSDYTVQGARQTDAGAYIVTVTGTGAGNFDTDSITAMLVIGPQDLSDAAIAVDPVTYTGAALEPGVSVSLGGRELAEGTDYALEYSDNTDAGTAVVKATGLGNYSGTALGSFTIAARDLSDATVSISEETYVYDGAAIEPAVTVALDGTELAAGTDYTVSYRDNDAVGRASAVVTGRGNYSGSVVRQFTIEPKPEPVVDPATDNPDSTNGGSTSTGGSTANGKTPDGTVNSTTGRTISADKQASHSNTGTSAISSQINTENSTSGLSGVDAASHSSRTSVTAPRASVSSRSLSSSSPATSNAPASKPTTLHAALVSYRGSLDGSSWLDWANVSDGVCGSLTDTRRLRRLCFRLDDSIAKDYVLVCRVRLAGKGWQNWQICGPTEAEAVDLAGAEGIRLMLVDRETADRLVAREIDAEDIGAASGTAPGAAYDVWYRTFVYGAGWLGWAANGKASGSKDCNQGINALEVAVLPDGSNAPGSTDVPYLKK